MARSAGVFAWASIHSYIQIHAQRHAMLSAMLGATNMEPGYGQPIDPPGTRPMSCRRFSWACACLSTGGSAGGFYKPVQELSQDYSSAIIGSVGSPHSSY